MTGGGASRVSSAQRESQEAGGGREGRSQPGFRPIQGRECEAREVREARGLLQGNGAGPKQRGGSRLACRLGVRGLQLGFKAAAATAAEKRTKAAAAARAKSRPGMWGPSGHLYPPERPQGGPGCGMGPLCPSERKQRQNHTSTLQELATLLPIPLQASSKKLTKKEILLHVLHYIEHLQRSIDVAKSLLLCQPSDKEERRAVAADPHPCLAPGRGPSQPGRQPADQSTPSRSGGDAAGGAALPRRLPTPCGHLESWSPPAHGGAGLTLLEMAEGGVQFCLARSQAELSPASPAPSCCGEASAQEERPYPTCQAQMTAGGGWLTPPPWSEPLPRQKLVFYDSCEEEEEAAVDTGPWLSAWSPDSSPHWSPVVNTPRPSSWPGVGQPSEVLGLSPSLFTSPGRLLSGKLLQEGTESFTQALFEDVCLSPQSSSSSASLVGAPQKKPQDPAPSAPGGPLHSLNFFQSAFSLDHCYLSLSETSKIDSSPSSGATELVSLWNRRQEASQSTPDGFLSSSDEDGDRTWTPTKHASPLPASGKKRRRGRAGPSGSSLGKYKESKKTHRPFQLKKKCVNGFIMFCRLNRKHYIRACPGTASTVATKALAHLWRVMTKQERRPYCIKARKFSRQHNRVVRQDCSSEDDDRLSPKPFHLLLAEKALCFPGLVCTSSPLGDPLPDSPASL
uniref:Basic helix-loop-helix and HMG box domain-containing protein 1 isoform X2 n=1 Tax=Phascolarctos cinereus TaxID=38626 RepID=A0A6P5JVF2_PHACI|nr:basic helix-loop-helix and HMG box domain-containing protein 1 isoform X2 [Phascolarctos cinereus]